KNTKKKFNIRGITIKNKFRDVEIETAQVEPEKVVKNTFFAHTNLSILKLVIDYVWRTSITRKRGDDFIFSFDNFIRFWSLITQENEDDIEIALEEPLLQALSFISGYRTFTQPIVANKLIKTGGIGNQILLTNGDTTDKDKLDYQPIENATYQSIACGTYEQRIWCTLTVQNSRVYISLLVAHSDPNTPKFSGTPSNIPLNAVIYVTKQSSNPIVWTNSVAIDCYINPLGNTIINTMCQGKNRES
ncbi:MAG: hypothetical protein EZS28_034516, partial [Streblomastix strix]